MSKMKNSGVEWIGNIPEDWKLQELQWQLSEVKDNNKDGKCNKILSLTNKLGVIPYEEKGAQGNNAKDDYTQYKIAYPDTIVANSMNILIGSVGICNYLGCVSPVYYVFKPNENANLKFINYIFQTTEFQKELRRYANGILEIRLRISSHDILRRSIPLPSKEIQMKIVSAIESKTTKIDALIANEEKQIEKLKAYKQALITETVTKGLDKNVKMKDSGVEWIGEIPEGWEVIPFKTVFKLTKGLNITKANLVENGLPVISYGQIHAKYNATVYVKTEMLRYVPESYSKNNENSFGKYGDIFIADTSEDYAGIGDCVRVNSKDGIYAGYHTILARPKESENSKYLSYLFMSDIWRNQLRRNAYGIKVYSVTQNMLKKIDVILPPKEVQEEIGNYLDSKCSYIDRLISIKESKIEKLNTYKKSLIYEYVTGKKEA